MNILTIAAGVLMILGLTGSIIPFLPGPPLAWIGLLLYGLATHFTKVSATAIVVFGILVVITVILEMAAPALVAKGGYKASRSGTWGALIGAMLGAFIFPPFGIIIGPFVGAFVGELLAVGNQKQAFRAAWGAFVGFLVGSALKFVATAIMVGYFVYKLF